MKEVKIFTVNRICFYIFLFFCLVLNIVLDINIKNYFYILEQCFNQKIELTSNLYMLICSIIALISIFYILDILLVTYKKKNQNKAINFKEDDGTYGTASWMQEKQINEILSFDKPGIILGQYNKKNVKLPFDSYFNKNICVFGSSGSMKTIGFLLTNLLELSKYNKSIVVTDPKGEIYRKTSNYFKSIGYVVKILNLKDMKHSDRWNPLKENELITDVQTSSNVIISNTQRRGRSRR